MRSITGMSIIVKEQTISSVRWRLWKGVAFAFFPMVLATLIYLMYREVNLVVFKVIDFFGLSAGIEVIRAPSWSHPPEFVIFSLPGALWLYAFSGFMMLLWRDLGSVRTRRCWALVPLIVAILSESFQWLGYTDGTFDWEDAAAYALAFLCAYLQMGQFRLSEKISQSSEPAVSALHGVSLAGAILFSVAIGAADAMNSVDSAVELRDGRGGLETVRKSTSNFTGGRHAGETSPQGL